MSKNIVISFPGIRGAEIPLLYFAAKYYEDGGYEKLFIGHPPMEMSDFVALYESAKSQIEMLNLNEYDKVVFIAKSLGTVIACKINQELEISAELILFTPLEETLPYIHRNNHIQLIAAGDKDRYLESKKLIAKCKSEGVPYYIENGVGHRMEVVNDLNRNLKIIEKIVGRL